MLEIAVQTSATFTDFPTTNSDLADDFVVPGGQTWQVQSIDAAGVSFNGTGPATDWNVFFYADSAGFPGTQIYSAVHQPVALSGNTFSVNLPVPAILNAGTYWVEIQANMTYSTQGQWGWINRTVTSNNPAVWRNPGGAYMLCPNWGRRGADCGTDPSEPDQVYRLNGTLVESTPTPTLGCYANFTTAAGCDALSFLTTGAGNTALGWRALFFRYHRQLQHRCWRWSAGPQQRRFQYRSWRCSALAQHHRHTKHRRWNWHACL